MKKKLLLALATIFCGCCCFNNASSKNIISSKTQSNKNAYLSNSYEDKKKNIFLKGTLSDKLEINEQSILNYMEEKKTSFMNVSGINNFKIISIKKDPDFPNRTIVRLSQAINYIPLRGTQIILHIDENGIVNVIVGSINHNYIKPDYDVKNPPVSMNEAITTAKNQFTYSYLYQKPTVQKQFIIQKGAAILVYDVNIVYHKPKWGNWDVLIGANSGNVIAKISNIRD
ncbi:MULTISPECIES: PepSY domain-containing protein [Clostridium]|uniref:PepSY domain-containing protein n=1 Tax=Clostridium TaxID=1485 RepID=UPI00082558A2|nr:MULTISPECIES: PepSY domain-containing protein [Clostridium]PJI09547.1 peptidase [Clostridium sp. CT7]